MSAWSHFLEPCVRCKTSLLLVAPCLPLRGSLKSFTVRDTEGRPWRRPPVSTHPLPGATQAPLCLTLVWQVGLAGECQGPCLPPCPPPADRRSSELAVTRPPVLCRLLLSFQCGACRRSVLRHWRTPSRVTASVAAMPGPAMTVSTAYICRRRVLPLPQALHAPVQLVC